ncbi:hypothetical protein BJX96DRAFT_121499 [Aspergillus floccosus]
MAGNAALGSRPAVGSSAGATLNTPNARVMETFGTNFYGEPLITTHKEINGPKGRLMGLLPPIGSGRIEKLS